LCDVELERSPARWQRALEEKRLQALMLRVDADLADGLSGELIAELERLVAENPFEERMWGQLMLALYRSGRPAEALETYQRARQLFVRELGLGAGRIACWPCERNSRLRGRSEEMSGRLTGRTALVTGAGRGIGRGVAITMAREGARVVVNDLGTSEFGEGADRRPAEQVTKEIVGEGGDAIADFGDITNPTDARSMVDTAIERWGKLDILVNAAGTVRLCTIVDIVQDDWFSQLAVHLTGYFNTTHYAAQHWVQLGESGRLINFASSAAWLSQPTMVSYATAKAGVVGFTRACANALAPYNVTCNAIAPVASTRLADAVKLPEVSSADAVGTNRDPIHSAPLVVYLASPAAGHVTGRVFTTEGGHYALLSEPHEERHVDVNFLTEPERAYEEFALLMADLSPRDLPYAVARLDHVPDWRDEYGVRVPRWDFTAAPR
jgi:3-oxoacyl-[acyl-carrier protein] reductase